MNQNSVENMALLLFSYESWNKKLGSYTPCQLVGLVSIKGKGKMLTAQACHKKVLTNVGPKSKISGISVNLVD